MKRIALIIGPALGIMIPLLVNIPGQSNTSTMMGIVVWMALWWISECVPLPVTALIPLIAYPLTGIATAKEVSPTYMTSIMFLFVGGFLIAQAMGVPQTSTETEKRLTSAAREGAGLDTNERQGQRRLPLAAITTS